MSQFKHFLLLMSFPFLVLATHYLGQNKAFYNTVLKNINKNYTKHTGDRQLSKDPFSKFSQQDLIQWDAEHYQKIKDQYYDQIKAGGDYIFAFFPLFPLFWKALGVGNLTIGVINFLLFVLGVFLLSNFKLNVEKTCLVLCLPTLTVFTIPYTEALYFFLISLGIWGFQKQKMSLYFIGFYLASLTRPSFTILLVALICTLVLFLRQYRFSSFLKRLFVLTIPLVLGTLSVSMFQSFFGADHFFKFIEVQKYWDNTLSIPHNFRGWSHESFSINLGITYLLFFPLLAILFFVFKQQVISNKKVFYETDFMLCLSIVYTVGMALFIYLFRGGSLHCLYRFTLCSPFFFYLLVHGSNYLYDFSNRFKKGYLTYGFTSLLIAFIISNYLGKFSFSNLGLLLLFSFFMLYVFQDQQVKKWHKTLLITTVVLNLFWHAYLLNNYLVNAWIFL